VRLSYAVATKDTRSLGMLAYRADFGNVVALLSDIGYQGIELMVRDPDELDAGEIESVLARYNLNVAAVGTGPVFAEDKLSFTDSDETVRNAAVMRACRIVRFASRFSSPVVIGKLRGRFADDVDENLTRLWARDGFLRVLDEAASYGTKVLIEPQSRVATNFIRSTQDGLDWIQELSHPAFGMTLDTFHMNIEDPSITASFIESSPFLQHVHFAENNRLRPGKGHIDFQEIVRVLRALRYDRYVTMEIAQIPDPETAAREAYAYIAKLLP
jgi:sugar phosphate isomerase/epimerase